MRERIRQVKDRGITLVERGRDWGFPVRLLSQVLLHNLLPNHCHTGEGRYPS